MSDKEREFLDAVARRTGLSHREISDALLAQRERDARNAAPARPTRGPLKLTMLDHDTATSMIADLDDPDGRMYPPDRVAQQFRYALAELQLASERIDQLDRQLDRRGGNAGWRVRCACGHAAEDHLTPGAECAAVACDCPTFRHRD